MFTFKLRRDTSSRWTIEDPVLSAGEPGFEVNTGRLKIGDGTKPWTQLDYVVPAESLPEHILSELPHPVYDDGPSLALLYENAKV